MRPINSEHLEQYIGHCAIEVHELVVSHEFQNPGRPRVVEHQHIGSKRRQSMMLQRPCGCYIRRYGTAASGWMNCPP